MVELLDPFAPPLTVAFDQCLIKAYRQIMAGSRRASPKYFQISDHRETRGHPLIKTDQSEIAAVLKLAETHRGRLHDLSWTFHSATRSYFPSQSPY